MPVMGFSSQVSLNQVSPARLIFVAKIMESAKQQLIYPKKNLIKMLNILIILFIILIIIDYIRLIFLEVVPKLLFPLYVYLMNKQFHKPPFPPSTAPVLKLILSPSTFSYCGYSQTLGPLVLHLCRLQPLDHCYSSNSSVLSFAAFNISIQFNQRPFKWSFIYKIIAFVFR